MTRYYIIMSRVKETCGARESRRKSKRLSLSHYMHIGILYCHYSRAKNWRPPLFYSHIWPRVVTLVFIHRHVIVIHLFIYFIS